MSNHLIEPIKAILTKETATRLAPGLYLVATPIGNLGDITLRGLTTLARVDYICCEDTRHSRKLLDVYGLSSPLTTYHDHNADRQRPKILKWLSEGASVALISDAGTPLISDPGFKLVREATNTGHRVFSLPGASSVMAALTVSGLPTDAFFFAGFLPPRKPAARRRLEDINEIPGTLVLFETAHRLASTIELLGELCSGRDLVIARELTKHFEECVHLSLPATTPHNAKWKGECVLLVSPPPPSTVSEEKLRIELAAALKQMTVRDAVEYVTRTFQVRRKMVYNLALQMQKGADHANDM
jgi:16S rRNA (cytidine1402-2'-O)-methyltransferase